MDGVGYLPRVTTLERWTHPSANTAPACPARLSLGEDGDGVASEGVLDGAADQGAKQGEKKRRKG